MATEVLIRVSAFLGVLSVMAFWEVLIPRRRLTTSKVRRWVANLSVVMVDTPSSFGCCLPLGRSARQSWLLSGTGAS